MHYHGFDFTEEKDKKTSMKQERKDKQPIPKIVDKQSIEAEGRYSEAFKVVMMGEKGKTAMVQRFVHDKFSDGYLMTVGMEPYSRYATIKDRKVLFSIWDIASQERFKISRGLFFKGALGTLIVFDPRRRESFDQVDELLKEIRSESPKVIAVLVSHLVDSDVKLVIDHDEAIARARDLDMDGYFATNSRTGENVAEVFEFIGEKLLSRREER